EQEREGPAQERQRHRRDVTGGEPSDNGIAGPAQRRDGEQQVRLIGDPVVAGLVGARGLASGGHLVVMAPAWRAPKPSARRCPGRSKPGTFKNTETRRISMARGASAPCAGRVRREPRSRL